MKRSWAIFLQVVVVLVGLGALAFLLVEPHFEGRNVNATVFQIYFNDPFLAFVYFGSIPFFVALYKAFKVLGSVGHNGVFSPEDVRALRTIRNCALSLVGFVAIAEICIFQMESDDRAGGVFMGLLVAFGSAAMAAAAAFAERKWKDAP